MSKKERAFLPLANLTYTPISLAVSCRSPWECQHIDVSWSPDSASFSSPGPAARQLLVEDAHTHTQSSSSGCQSESLAHRGCRHSSLALPFGLPYILPLQSAQQGTVWLLMVKSQIHFTRFLSPNSSALTCFHPPRIPPPGSAGQLSQLLGFSRMLRQAGCLCS